MKHDERRAVLESADRAVSYLSWQAANNESKSYIIPSVGGYQESLDFLEILTG